MSRCTCPPAHPDDLARHEDDCPMARPIAEPRDLVVHLRTERNRLEQRYKCGKTWPRELWGNWNSPAETDDPTQATCAGCRP